MKKVFLCLLVVLLLPTANAFGAVTWGQVIDTQAEHDEYCGVTSHFTREWRTTGSWSGEGYYRWTVSTAAAEDDDGYWINHPQTTGGPVYLSFVGRWGSSWVSKHVGGGWKYAMFYNTTDGNPRPTVFWESVTGGSGSYAVLGPDIAAGGNGIDEFGEGYPSVNYPNHTYKELDGTAADQWYFYVFGLVGNYIYVWIYSQDGTLAGGAQGNSYFAISQEGSFGGYTWNSARLLAYVEQTANGDANSFVDVSHISVTQTKPSVPDGFLTSSPTRKLNNVTGVRVTLH